MKKKRLFYLICGALLFAVLAGAFAACGKVQFKLSFVVEGEVYATVDTTGEEVVRIPDDPVKEGAEFDGWFWDEGTWTRPFTASSLLNNPLTGNMSVYAKFRTENDLGNTELAMEGFEQIESEEIGKAFFIALPNSRLVYSFQNAVKVDARSTWALSTDIYGNDTIASKTVNLREGNNLFYILVTDQYGRSEQYAVLVRRRPLYRVVFDTKGGSGCEVQNIEEGECCKEPVTSRTGYTFDGWDFDFDDPITSDTYITANWTANTYRISYNPNGGHLADTEQIVSYGSYVSLAVPDREGYIFSEWRMGDGTPYHGGIWEYTTDIRLVAAWQPITYHVSYELLGGDFSIGQQEYYSTGTTAFTVENPKRTGYTFKGWWREGKFYPSHGSGMEIECSTGDITLTAEWEANTYRIALNAEGGECDAFIDVTYGETFTLPTPTRIGYTFGGWKRNGAPFESGVFDLAVDIVLTASWTPVEYSIEYDTKGGSLASPKVKYNIEEEFNLFAPSKSGYTFVGWTQEGETVPVSDYGVSRGTYGDLKFTAHWKANDYTLSFDVNGGEEEIPDMTVTYDAPYTLPKVTRTGYDFIGWYYYEDFPRKFEDGVWQRIGNYRLRAEWVARTDTAYLVRHYLEKLEGGYTLISEEPLQGTSDETVYIQPKTFSGFTSEWYHQNLLGKDYRVEADGSLVVDIYYTRNEYTLSFSENGGEEVADITVKFEAPLAVLPTVRNGFTFGGWFEDIGLTVPFELTTMPARSLEAYAWWSEETKAGDLQYSLNEGGSIAIVKIKEGLEEVLLPTYIGGKLVTCVFDSCSSLRKIVVPDTVDFISTGAFHDCGNLEELTLPFIGESFAPQEEYQKVFGTIFGYSFSYSNEAGTVKQLNGYNYYIPKTIKKVTVTRQTELPAYAFRNCDFIEHISIPTDTVKIGDSAFSGCAALSTLNSETEGEFVLPGNVKVVPYFGGCKAMKKFVTGSVTSIYNYAFANCNELVCLNGDREGEFIVPDSVTEIGRNVFQGIAVQELTLPFIGESFAPQEEYQKVFGFIFGYSFSYSNEAGTVKQLDGYNYYIPKTIKKVTVTRQTELPAYAFRNCDFIEHISIPTNTVKVGDSAFSGCAALSTLNSETEGEFNIPLGVTAIENSAFYRCEKLEKVSFSDDASVAPNAFNNTALTQKTGVIYLGKILYRYNGTMPSGYTLNIKPGTVAVLEKVFDGQTGLKNVIFPNGIKRIGQYAFRGCTSIENISLPSSVEEIGKGAFAKCGKLKSIEVPFIGTEVEKGTFTDIFETKPSSLTSVTVLNGGAIPENAFSGYSALEQIEFRGEIASIGNSAFSACSGLISLVLPGEVTFVGARAFEKCTKLKALSLPATTRSLGNYAFCGCKSLGSVTFAEGSLLGSIGQYAFQGCSALTAIELPAGIVAVEEHTFSDCSGLDRVILSANIRSIGRSAFENCKSLSNIMLPSGLVSVEAYAFRGCAALKEIAVPASVRNMGEYVFGGCTALQIKCAADSMPEEWDYNWNPDGCEVAWGCV